VEFIHSEPINGPYREGLDTVSHLVQHWFRTCPDG